MCAVRGGPGSHFTRRAALERSIAIGAPLYLLVAVAPNAYRPLHPGEQRAIRAELAWRELALARANGAPRDAVDAALHGSEVEELVAAVPRMTDADVSVIEPG